MSSINIANLHWGSALSSRSAILLCVLSTAFSFNDSIEAAEPEVLPQISSWQWLEGRRDQVSRNVTALGRNLDAWHLVRTLEKTRTRPTYVSALTSKPPHSKATTHA